LSSNDHESIRDDELSGLQWLSRERPEAMQHLLAFFRESGRHLDPKTRFLISIVTKVVRLSERGLRQYIPRAMREGASRDEVLDAILCAYPAAGLTNVIDAVGVLRSLEPPPGTEELPGEPEWTTVARVADLAPGSATVVEARGRRLALYNVDGSFHATANSCLHQGGELGCGALEGSVVTCHRHGWTFDVTTGACLTRPGDSVASYPVRVEDEAVRVLA
jgi:nitrite reductase/ring-hydroxylating ferredoxin subunit/alkylhydroperoxidase/carboxymuconolactone decarboxylase family protein YurZ